MTTPYRASAERNAGHPESGGGGRAVKGTYLKLPQPEQVAELASSPARDFQN